MKKYKYIIDLKEDICYVCNELKEVEFVTRTKDNKIGDCICRNCKLKLGYAESNLILHNFNNEIELSYYITNMKSEHILNDLNVNKKSFKKRLIMYFFQSICFALIIGFIVYLKFNNYI